MTEFGRPRKGVPSFVSGGWPSKEGPWPGSHPDHVEGKQRAFMGASEGDHPDPHFPLALILPLSH